MENIPEFILSQLETWGYLIVLLVTFLENSAFLGLVMPGDITLLVAGLLASQGRLNLWLLIVIASIAAIAGDSVGYAIGRYGGIKFIRRFGRYFFFRESHLRKTQKYFDIHGGKTVFFGRFIAVIKALGPVAAGIGHMPYPTFLFYNAFGGILSVSFFLTLGYFFGASWRVISDWAGRGGGAAFTLLVVIAFVVWFVRRRRRLKEENAAPPDSATG
ncbi:MAG: DedA family protein [Thermoleophilia bacterium]|nr:DedA family protein [Thermoleophilia bacterium]